MSDSSRVDSFHVGQIWRNDGKTLFQVLSVVKGGDATLLNLTSRVKSKRDWDDVVSWYLVSDINAGEGQSNDRKSVLLRAAYDLLKRSSESQYVVEAASILTRYDEANCDGWCLIVDIAEVLELSEGEKPIPLGDEDL